MYWEEEILPSNTTACSALHRNQFWSHEGLCLFVYDPVPKEEGQEVKDTFYNT